jgi:hypothetical protein
MSCGIIIRPTQARFLEAAGTLFVVKTAETGFLLLS